MLITKVSGIKCRAFLSLELVAHTPQLPCLTRLIKIEGRNIAIMTSPATKKMDIYQAVVLDVDCNDSIDHIIIGRTHHIIPENLRTIWNHPPICGIKKEQKGISLDSCIWDYVFDTHSIEISRILLSRK